MKSFLIIAMMLTFKIALANNNPSTIFYVGEAIVTSSNTNEVSRSPYIVARTVDPLRGTISETVVAKHENGYSENSSVMTVIGNQFTMTESTGMVEGNGELTGKPWEWTFLRGEFRMNTTNYSIRIVDYNFFADSDSIMGHKDFYLKLPGETQEQMIQQEDVILHQATEQEYKIQKSRLLGHIL